MILVDTSVWVLHLSKGVSSLRELLEAGQVLLHPMVRGEISLGNLPNRSHILQLLALLPSPQIADLGETLEFIERHKLHGTGIGWVDANLLASARLSSAPLWSLDKPLNRAAQKLNLVFHS